MPGNKEAFSAAINAAVRFFWENQWEKAIQQYQKALVEFPDDVLAHDGLGFCYMQTKQWQLALREYEYILLHNPNNLAAVSNAAKLYFILNKRNYAYKSYLHLGELYSQAGLSTHAVSTWQEAVQLFPNQPEPHIRLASHYLQKNNFTLMVQERIAAAQCYLLRNDSTSASTQCEEVLRVDSTNTQAQQLLSQIKKQVQSSDQSASFTTNSKEVRTSLTSHKRIIASEVLNAMQQALAFQSQGRSNDAIDFYETILESGFDRPDTHYLLGRLYQEQHRWDEAIRQFQVLLHNSNYVLSCYYALRQCYRGRGDLHTSTTRIDETLEKVNLDSLTIKDASQLVRFYQEIAEAHRLLGEREQVITIFSALLDFLRDRGWTNEIPLIEFMLQQALNEPPSLVSTMPPDDNTFAPASTVMATSIGTTPELSDWLMDILSNEDEKMQRIGSEQSSSTQSTFSPSPVRTDQISSLAEMMRQSGNKESGVNKLPDWLTGSQRSQLKLWPRTTGLGELLARSTDIPNSVDFYSSVETPQAPILPRSASFQSEALFPNLAEPQSEAMLTSPTSSEALSFAWKKQSELPLANPVKMERNSLFAITHTEIEKDQKAFVGKVYSIQIGISQTEGGATTINPPDLLRRNSSGISFEILSHSSDNIEVSSWHQSFQYYPYNRQAQLIDFTFQVLAPGKSFLVIDFYHELRWLKTMRIEFDAVDKLDLTVVSSKV